MNKYIIENNNNNSHNKKQRHQQQQRSANLLLFIYCVGTSLRIPLRNFGLFVYLKQKSLTKTIKTREVKK